MTSEADKLPYEDAKLNYAMLGVSVISKASQKLAKQVSDQLESRQLSSKEIDDWAEQLVKDISKGND